MTVLVLGASRGIGFEFARQYRAAGERVIATARDDAGLKRLQSLGAEPLRLDVTDVESASGLGGQLAGEPLGVAIYVAGIMSRGGARQAPAPEDFDRVMHTNVLGAMIAIPQVAPLVAAASGKFVFISSQMGQIGGASSSYSWLYRTSKAALNMAVVAAQADHPGAIMVAMSPGWVATDMGGPSAPLKAQDSVSAMRAAIAGLTRRHQAAFLDYDGQRMKSW
ncbi:MAG TPA: SDR family oxidoreductase [Ramlibacter sp.]|uniref:SDR family oxidoreductase n=1 Tax=Ramlibacter sp. TaxID=1917967 RepID=UPI002BCAB95F|nr:SDR family oxidoreductase [Ramlibacter sp.]HVZ44078.1 SDR family oxidoreductase [Ramlibacter sp.]